MRAPERSQTALYSRRADAASRVKSALISRQRKLMSVGRQRGTLVAGLCREQDFSTTGTIEPHDLTPRWQYVRGHKDQRAVARQRVVGMRYTEIHGGPMAGRLRWTGHAKRVDVEGRDHQHLIAHEREVTRLEVPCLDRVLDDDVTYTGRQDQRFDA